MKTSELKGAALDWAVNQIEECCDDPHTPPFSTNWACGGPIIEREKLCLDVDHSGVWIACTRQNYNDERRFMHGAPTPLIAAMRCYVASKLGDEVEIPEGLEL